MADMDTKRICKECGATLAADAPEGLCPQCLLKVALGTQPAESVGAPPGESSPLPDPARLASLFPQLEILELLGRGGMGAVYKARQPALDRLVALKILPQTTRNDAAFAERFNREARALAKLSHPNIVAVYDFGQAQGLHYFIMEYVDGPNLRQIERANKLSTREALQIIPQICEALQFAHDEGVVHRDIKPENVLLDKKGRVKIADFGLAKLLGVERRDLKLTGAGDVMGTPHYMAPEQVEHPQEVDHRADIYSLGVVFYELLTGELPLGKFAPPSQKVSVDVRLDEIVLHTLEKEPSRRYQHASQVKSDVETIAVSSGRAPVAQAQNQSFSRDGSKYDDAWRQVKGPAIGLVVAGILNWLAIPLGLFAIMFVRNEINRHNLMIIIPLGSLALGGIMFAAGLRMKRLEAYSFAVIGSIFAILLPPGNLIGFPIGIWALVVLTGREVRAAFVAQARGEILGGPPVTPPAPGSGALKVVGVILAAIMLFLAIPVAAILLAIAVPNYVRARRASEKAAAADLAALNVSSRSRDANPAEGAPGTENPARPSLSAWLSEEDIDLNRMDTNAAPNAQVMIENLQPDGTSQFRNIIRQLWTPPDGREPLLELQFVNSDFVDLRHVYDDEANSLPFVTTHRVQRFHYTVSLHEPVLPGHSITYGSEGTMRNKVDEEAEHGTFSYSFNHSPNASVATRRVEIHRLPAGAELLEVSSNATSRVRNGRVEIVLDQNVPAGESVALSYRYRLAPATPPTPPAR